jgi:hypothetical protein
MQASRPAARCFSSSVVTSLVGGSFGRLNLAVHAASEPSQPWLNTVRGTSGRVLNRHNCRAAEKSASSSQVTSRRGERPHWILRSYCRRHFNLACETGTLLNYNPLHSSAGSNDHGRRHCWDATLTGLVERTGRRPCAASTVCIQAQLHA